jgi:hypothetical protein
MIGTDETNLLCCRDLYDDRTQAQAHALAAAVMQIIREAIIVLSLLALQLDTIHSFIQSPLMNEGL